MKSWKSVQNVHLLQGNVEKEEVFQNIFMALGCMIAKTVILGIFTFHR